MKSKKVLPLISLLFVAIMLFSVGMIAKEYREVTVKSPGGWTPMG